MTEKSPVFRRIEDGDFDSAIHERVREPDMQTQVQYTFVARLSETLVPYGEFQAKLTQVIEKDLGRAGLVLYLFDPQTNMALRTMNASSENGLITPDVDRRLSHIRFGNLGIIKQGYLLDHPTNPSLRALSQPEVLIDHVNYYPETQALALEGIFPSHN